jgi:CubicO group peptidase (beta-lactamase class C family)
MVFEVKCLPPNYWVKEGRSHCGEMIRMKPCKLIAVLSAFMVVVSVNGICRDSKVTWPDTASAKLLQQWLAMCTTPDVATIEKWSSAHYEDAFLKRASAKEIADSDVEECTKHGGYRPVQIIESKPGEIKVLVEGIKSGVYAELEVSSKGDGKMGPIQGSPASIPETMLPKDLNDVVLKSEAQSSMEKLSRQGMASGIVIAARGTQPIAIVTAGYADRAKRTQITPTSQFTLGSMGKMFTAAAIGQLVDHGKVSYDDPVGKFFPDYPNKTVREKVTVGMLLSHTGGMRDFLAKRTPEMMKNGVKRASEFMPLFDNDEPKFEPGTSWAYSNAGLALAGAIVEKASGEDYPDYIRKHIFEPAGMKNSDPNNIPHSDPRMVTPYTHRTQSGPSKDWVEAEHDIGSPAGGAISTAEDLLKFADALQSGKLVSKATFDKMTQPHGKTPWGEQYGYAMEIGDEYGQTIVGHGGGFPGVSTHLYILLGSQYTVVTLANQDPPASEFAAQRLKALVAEKAKQGK